VLAVGDYWEDPATVVPQIEALLSALNMPAGDCGSPDTSWCGTFSFVSESHDDIWEGQATGSPCSASAWNGDIYFGWAQIGCTPDGTNGVIMNIHAHFAEVLTLNRMEILYDVLSPSGATETYVILWKGTTRATTLVFSDGGLGITTDMVHNRDFSDQTGQDFVVEVQVQNESPSGPIRGDVVIHEVRFFGTGTAPTGSTVCA